MMYIRVLSLALFLSVVFAQTGLEGSKWGLVKGQKCESGYELSSNDCRKAAEKMGKTFKAVRSEYFSQVPAGCYYKGTSKVYFSGDEPKDNNMLPTGSKSLICEKPPVIAPTESSEEETEYKTFTKCKQVCDLLPGKVEKRGMEGRRCNNIAANPCTASRCCETGVERTAWEVEEENDVVFCDANDGSMIGDVCCPNNRIYYNQEYKEACCPAGTTSTGSFSKPCAAASTKSLLAVNRALKEALKAALN